MLNDNAMVKVVKQGNKKGKRLFVYNVDGNYYFSDTYGIYKIFPDYHKKTAQELAKIFMGLPGEGESRGINNKEKTDSIPDITKIFFDAENASYEHELKATDYLKEIKNHKSKITMVARILVNNEFATIINDSYFKVVEEYHILKTNSQKSMVAVFQENELLAVIMPINPGEDAKKLDKFVEIAA